MARRLLLCSLAASASALVAPVPAAKSAVAMNYQASEALPFMEKPEALDGTYAGDVGFDPFGFTSIFDVKWLCRARVFGTSRGARRWGRRAARGRARATSSARAPRTAFPRAACPKLTRRTPRREAEIKHGRICMLAWTGFIATDLGFTLPGDMHQVSSVLAHDVACKYGAMQQLFLWLSFTEVILSAGVAQMMWMGSPREPGDYGLDPLDFCSTPEKKADMKLKEITHCRLAMFAFSGVVTQAVLTGKGFPYF